MLKAENMVKLRVYSPKTYLKSVIEEMYDAKAVDIIHHNKTEELDIGTPMTESSEVSDAVVKARSMIYRLKIDSEETKFKKLDEKDIKKHIKETLLLNKELSEAFESRKNTKNKIKILKENKAKLSSIQHLGVSLELYKETKHINFFIGNVDEIKVFKDDLKKEVKNGYEVFTVSHMNKPLISVFINKEKEWKLLEVLRKHSFTEVKIPQEYQNNKNALKDIEKELKTEEKNLDTYEKAIMDIKKKHSKDLLAKEDLLSIAAKKMEAPLMFAETKNLAIISGWVPQNHKEKLVKKLEKVADNNINVEELEVKKEDSVPIKLNNPLLIRPYEFLLRLFSMPSYKELDPSLFMFITFPLFFGFMLGDIGYGLTTLLLFTVLKFKMPKAKALLNIMIFCSISSIIFGVAFGEVYGFEISEWLHEQPETAMAHNPVTELHPETATIEMHEGEGHLPETVTHGEDGAHAEGGHETHGFLEWVTMWPWHRNADNALNLIIFAIIIGAIHVNLGLLFGFFNVLRAHGFMHALYEKGSWFLLEISVAIIAFTSMGIVFAQPAGNYLGGGLLLVAVVMLYKGEGVQGIVELPSIFVHIGSYMRLMAIGLASVGLAVVINEQTVPLFQSGIFGIIGGILIFTVGHVINIALGIIGPFLHSLRLHYVEHFTKFYKGGGKEFSPFGADEE